MSPGICPGRLRRLFEPTFQTNVLHPDEKVAHVKDDMAVGTERYQVSLKLWFLLWSGEGN